MSQMLNTLGIILIWVVYIAACVWLTRKGRKHDSLLPGSVGFVVQAFAYVATYISTVALIGFSGLAHAYGLQILLVAAGVVVLGTGVVYRFLAWPTRQWQERLGARSPAQLLGLGHNSPLLGRALALVFAVFLGVYASAVIKGAALLLVEILPIPLWIVIWILACVVGLCVHVGGLRGVLYTEAMQGAVMLGGMLLIIGAVFAQVGGPLNGVLSLAALPPDHLANNGFTALSSGEAGWFVLSLVAVTSVAVWAQPQMIQRHFVIASPGDLVRSSHMAMLVLTVLVGGTFFAAALSRLILPEATNPDAVMPLLVSMLLPEFGMHMFVLAIVSAALSTVTALFHIAASAVAEDVPARRSTRASWLLGIVLCILVSGGSAQISGQMIAVLCTTSWSVVGATVLVPYVALVRWNQRNAPAAWMSAVAGFGTCMVWYLFAYGPNAVLKPLIGSMGHIPPFFVGLAFSLVGWGLGVVWNNLEGLCPSKPPRKGTQ
jgi:SSS family solute:Na+ symporter